MYNEEEDEMFVNSKKMSYTNPEPEKLVFMDDIKNIIQQSMKEKGVSAKEVRKTLGIKRYEKNNITAVLDTNIFLNAWFREEHGDIEI